MSEPILIINNLKKYFPLKRSLKQVLTFKKAGYVKAVDGVTFNVKKGEIFCLVGESGCGKTTTGRLIARLINPTGGEMYFKPKPEILELVPDRYIYKGKYVKLEKLPSNIDKLLRREIQIIFQDPFGSLNPRQTVYSILEEPLLIHGLGKTKDERTEIIYRALTEVKITPPDEFIGRYPHMLSGGQRQRVAIARTLVLRPSMIVADEPVSMLDVSIRAEILQLMLDLKESRQLTYVFITHDLAVAAYLCDRIAVMYLGKIVEIAPTNEIINNPNHPYTKALLAAVPEPDPSNRFKIREIPIIGEVPSAANVPPGCRFHTRCPYAMDICKKKEPDYIEVGTEHYSACWLNAKESKT
jgi:peptide/nickel transport system ATP-binding protein